MSGHKRTPRRVRYVREPDVVLVLGAASGIGAALTKLLAPEFEVIAADIRTENLAVDQHRPLGGGHDVSALRVDVTQRDQVNAAITFARSRCTRPTGARLVVINCAGVSYAGSVERDSIDQVVRLAGHRDGAALAERIMQTNVMGAINAVTAATASVVQGQFSTAHVVNVASFAGLTAVPGLALYSAAKHAVRAYSLAAREELHGSGVMVSVVAVDAVDTPMLRAQVGQPEAAVAFGAPRLLSADKVAATIRQRVLTTAPAEVLIPRGRGVVMKIGGFSPRMSVLGSRRYARRGLARQRDLIIRGWDAHSPERSKIPQTTRSGE